MDLNIKKKRIQNSAVLIDFEKSPLGIKSVAK